MIETTLMIDSYGRNREYRGDTAMVHQIYNLFIMEKGTDELNPDKGIDIAKYYYAIKEDSTLMQLETEIRDQIATYTPYEITNVICKGIKNKIGKYILHVFVQLSDITDVVNVSTNGEDTQLAMMQL